ncbi:MAG: prephenate dehydrogenase/arogenate dehydrogenase family protein [Methanomassiliicoccales archaeon]|nr:prephenate dehydrogenase/arogenate dehydrogenase family protein [Methanomassiliicoccales archaeon]
MTDRLEQLRQRIEEIDNGIMKLITERIEIGKEIGRIKLENAMPLRNKEIEEKVISRYINWASKIGISENSARNLSSILIDETIEAQYRMIKSEKSSNVLVIGGAGKMGNWLCRYLAAKGHRVIIHDKIRSELFPFVERIDDVVCNMDFVIIATPISTIENCLKEIIAKEPKGVIFDISSIKTPIINSLKDAAKRGYAICSVHPMFGPNTNSIWDKNIIVCDCGSKEAVEAAVDLIGRSTTRIIRMPIDEHDRLMAYVLGMSHALNIAFINTLTRSGYSMEMLKNAASTTFSKQLATSRDVANENAHLYFEIQHFNPYNVMALDQLVQSLDEIKKAGLNDDRSEFLNIMENGRKYLGGE